MSKSITDEDFVPDILLALLAVREATWLGVFTLQEAPEHMRPPNAVLVARTMWGAHDLATACLAEYGLLPE